MPISPLSVSSQIRLLQSIPADFLKKRWMETYGIDMGPVLDSASDVELYECERTELRFFMPSTFCTAADFFERLQNIDWYYMEDKWEYQRALKDLKDCQNILEIGCGQGAFLELLKDEPRGKILGLELNTQALQTAREKKLPVSGETLEAVARVDAGCYDAVCAFQVLEHVPDPKKFLVNAIDLLAPGGKLILSVPNAKSFIRHDPENVMNLPPHHVTQWCHATFVKLEDLFPLKLHRVCFEPLAWYHAIWYVRVQLGRLARGVGLKQFCTTRYANILGGFLKRQSLLRSWIRGHTIYVCYEKI